MSERTTQLLIASHRRFVIDTMIPALRSAFGSAYDRDPQLVNQRISNQYPLKQIDYPTIVVEYQNSSVSNAGVGHEEWFNDELGHLHKWYHSRFEGQMDFEILALTPLDRDLLADALTELLRFGRLDAAFAPFFNTLYGDPNGPVQLWFNQIAVNTDEITSAGNTASPAPWNPEDLLVYQTSLSTEIHGGYYNVDPNDIPQFVTSIQVVPYNSSPFDVPIVLDLTRNWSNPFSYYDDGKVVGKAVVSGTG